MPGPISPLESLWRQHRVRLRAALLGRLRDLDRVEEALSAALLAAQTHWGAAPCFTRDGDTCPGGTRVPHDPAAWLYQVALRKAWDQSARERTRADNLPGLLLAAEAGREADESSLPENRLGLFFHCAHPALSEKARVALILRACCDVSVERIARSFFEDPATTAQRIVRGKQKLKAVGAAVTPEAMGSLTARLQTVLDVIEIIYDQSYRDIAGDNETAALGQDALVLAASLVELMPAAAEAHGLLAMLCFCESRRPARIDANGCLIPLDRQDPDLWNWETFHRGAQALEAASRLQAPGPLQVRAMIHALAARKVRTGEDLTRQILDLHDQLAHYASGPAVWLARLCALADVVGASPALAAMDELDWPEAVRSSLSYCVTRAELLWRSGRADEAAQVCLAALAAGPGEAERRFLVARLDQIRSGPPHAA